MLQHIFSFLPSSSLISVMRTSTQWRDLSRRPLAALAARIQSSFADSSYILSDYELDTAADLVTIGYLSEVGMKNLSSRIQSLCTAQTNKSGQYIAQLKVCVPFELRMRAICQSVSPSVTFQNFKIQIITSCITIK